jgi:hypothetical protein
MFAAARAALEEFGGLRVEARGPGLDHARSSFRIDPGLAQGEEERFAAHEEKLRRRLYPLGEVDGGHGFLAIDEGGAVYVVTDDAVMRVAGSTYAALEALVLGRRFGDDVRAR